MGLRYLRNFRPNALSWLDSPRLGSLRVFFAALIASRIRPGRFRLAICKSPDAKRRRRLLPMAGRADKINPSQGLELCP